MPSGGITKRRVTALPLDVVLHVRPGTPVVASPEVAIKRYKVDASYRKWLEPTIAYNWNDVCASLGSAGFRAEAVRGAEMVLECSQGGVLMGFVLLMTSASFTELDGAPGHAVCAPDEWYVNVVCGRTVQGKSQGVGRRLMTALYALAEANGVRQLRLYAVDAAFEYWKKQGFMECEDACAPQCTEVKRTYALDPTAGRRMTRCVRR